MYSSSDITLANVQPYTQVYDELASTKKIMRPITARYHTLQENKAQLNKPDYYTGQPTTSTTGQPTVPTVPTTGQPSVPVVGPTTNCKNLVTGQPLYDENTTICFYESTQPYNQFTNFYLAPITIGGSTYLTSEHYFQSQKFIPPNQAIADQIKNAPTPRDAFNIARTNNNLVRNDWHTGYKDIVMLQALQAKFTQHNDLRQLLINTGNKTLVEHTTNDNYWGDNGDNTGKNKLGQLLMQVRQQLVSNQIGGMDYYLKYIKYKLKYMKLKEDMNK
jgi:N-glycosidase YbiA